MKTIVSGVTLPPEWLPTSSTPPSSGTLPSPRTSPRKYSEHSSHRRGQALADVVRVALVEVGGRDPAGHEALDAAEDARRAARRRSLRRPPPRPGSPPERGPAGRRRRSRGRSSRWRSRRRSSRGRRARRPGRRSAPAGRSCARGARPAARGRSRRAGSAPPTGSQRSTWRWKPGGISLSCEDQTNIAGGCELREPRVEAAAAERALQVDVARRAQEGQARAGAAVDALELVDGDVGDGRVDEVAVGEQRPELRLDAARGRASAAAGRTRAAARARAGATRAARTRRRGTAAPGRRRARGARGPARSPRGRPSSCRPRARARCPARPSRRPRVRAKNARVVGGQRRLGGAAEARAGRCAWTR